MKRIPVTDRPRQGSRILADRARQGRAAAAIEVARRHLDSLQAELDAATARVTEGGRERRVVRILVDVLVPA